MYDERVSGGSVHSVAVVTVVQVLRVYIAQVHLLVCVESCVCIRVNDSGYGINFV